MKKLLETTWFIFLLAMALGLILPVLSFSLEPFLIYLLIIINILSTRDIDLASFFRKESLKKSLMLFIVNYILLSGIIVLLSFIFLSDSVYLPGFIIMASVPCAIAVIPFTKLLKGDTTASTYGLIFSYLVSLVITPAIIWLFFKEKADIIELIKTIFLLVMLPLIFSRFLKKFNPNIDKYDKAIINSLFFVTVYGFVGLNSAEITRNFFSLLDVMIVLFLRTFVLTTIIYFLTRKNKKFGISITIFSSYKNLGYAAILSLALFGRESALPATFAIIFETLDFIWLERLVKATQ